jgi:hypothetical protein
MKEVSDLPWVKFLHRLEDRLEDRVEVASGACQWKQQVELMIQK